MKNRYVTVLIHLLDLAHRGVESDPVVEAQNVFIGHVYDWAVVLVERIGVGDDRVEVVVSAGELENDDYGISSFGCDVWAPCVFGPLDVIAVG
jgi:hypothetical protein